MSLWYTCSNSCTQPCTAVTLPLPISLPTPLLLGPHGRIPGSLSLLLEAKSIAIHVFFQNTTQLVLYVYSAIFFTKQERKKEWNKIFFFFSPEKCKYNRRMPVSISTACTCTRAGPPLQAGTPASIWEWPTWGCLGQCGRDAVLSACLPCCSNLVPGYCFFSLYGRIYMMPFLEPSLHECTRISVQKEARPHERSNCISSLWNQAKVTAFQWERQPEGQQKNH